MAIASYFKWDPVTASQMGTLGQNEEFIAGIVAGAHDFISNIRSPLATLCACALTDLVAHDPTAILQARRWKTAVIMMSHPDGFRRIVDDLIQLIRLRMIMRVVGDPDGEIYSRIDNLRASMMHIIDCASLILPNV